MPSRIESDSIPIVDELVAASRALGKDPRLVLQGGGNTSVKVPWHDATGRTITALLIKGSGHDLATIEREGFAPLRLERLQELLPPTQLDDADLANELRCALLDQHAPDPSVETLVHAALPHAAILHSHAGSVLEITNTPRGAERVYEIWGEKILIVEYAMPGPALAAACHTAWQLARDKHEVVEGIIVLNHGLFTFAETPAQALTLHRRIIETADNYILHNYVAAPRRVEAPQRPVDVLALAQLRKNLNEVLGRPMILRSSMSAQIDQFTARADLLEAAGRGPLTPDHVIWTGRSPMVGRDLAMYQVAYTRYFTEHSATSKHDLDPLPGAPRVILDAGMGMVSVGRSGEEAEAVKQIYLQTMDSIATAEGLGGYRPANSRHVFDLEYWPPQQEKLKRRDEHLPLSGQVALVTGAASGIGRACAEALLSAGACVIGWDISPTVTTTFDTENWLGLKVDVSDSALMQEALASGISAFGGLDIVVIAAGIFPKAQHLTELDSDEWRRTMAINVDSVAALYGQIQPLLKKAWSGGRVVVIASKNVAAPGPGAAAYSASKAALTQLSRVAALEWAVDGIRVNMVHPDAVFDTALWTPELLATRAAHYGLSVEQYKRRNLLRTEVTSKVVARLVQAMSDEIFSCTTGAQIPVDGGNERVI